MYAQAAASHDHTGPSQQAISFKTVLIGDKSVGKTSIAKRYIENTFNDHTEATIGAAFFSKMVSVSLEDEPSVLVKLQIWDTAGEEKFRSLTPMYYKDAAGIIMIYDITNKDTFESLTKWAKEIDNNRT